MDRAHSPSEAVLPDATAETAERDSPMGKSQVLEVRSTAAPAWAAVMAGTVAFTRTTAIRAVQGKTILGVEDRAGGGGVLAEMAHMALQDPMEQKVPTVEGEAPLVQLRLACTHPLTEMVEALGATGRGVAEEEAAAARAALSASMAAETAAVPEAEAV
jgi:hypothetical protein